ncbi:MAG: HD domain-containing protein [Candidatus Pacebacteria bacterium]|nr:HD domain-containing protein [Candidatus Paceibacterota bacterium]
MKSKSNYRKIVNFFYEVGTMRRLPRIHRQTLLVDDVTDTIASHSYRVALIGWFLAKEEKVDPYKVVMMCLLHDVGEARTGDHNWVHKRYIKIFDEEVMKEQLGNLPHKEILDIAEEYHERKSKESIVAKHADLLDQVLLLREYEWQGNKEAPGWLKGRPKDGIAHKLSSITLPSAKKLGEEMFKTPPSEWWANLSTSKNR